MLPERPPEPHVVGLNALPYSTLSHAEPPTLPHPAWVPPPPTLEATAVPAFAANPLPLTVMVPETPIDPATSFTVESAPP